MAYERTYKIHHEDRFIPTILTVRLETSENKDPQFTITADLENGRSPFKEEIFKALGSFLEEYYEFEPYLIAKPWNHAYRILYSPTKSGAWNLEVEFYDPEKDSFPRRHLLHESPSRYIHGEQGVISLPAWELLNLAIAFGYICLADVPVNADGVRTFDRFYHRAAGANIKKPEIKCYHEAHERRSKMTFPPDGIRIEKYRPRKIREELGWQDACSLPTPCGGVVYIDYIDINPGVV